MPTEEFDNKYRLGDHIDLEAFWNRIIREAAQNDAQEIPSYIQVQERELAQANRNGGFYDKVGILRQWEALLQDILSPNFPVTANWLYNQVAILEQNLASDKGALAQKPSEKEDDQKKLPMLRLNNYWLWGGVSISMVGTYLYFTRSAR